MFYTVMGVLLLGMACIGAVLFIWQDMRERRNTMSWKKRPRRKDTVKSSLLRSERRMKLLEASGGCFRL